MKFATLCTAQWFKRHRAPMIAAAARPVIEPLEARALLSGTFSQLWVDLGFYAPAHQTNVHHASHKPHAPKHGANAAGQLLAEPTLQVEGAASSAQGAGPDADTNPTPIPTTLSPALVQQAYGFNNILLPNGAPATGAGETIAIVDAYHDPNIQSDLHTFDAQYFGGVDPTLTQVNLGTSTNTDPTGDWELEESLDVEWAHAVAPQASIILVEAVTNSTTNLLAAVDKAVSFSPQVVSMSWSGNEFSGEAADDSHFAAANIAFVASAGDSGPAEFPNTSPNVLSVGGTSLALNSDNEWSGEVGWFDSGGGPGTYESRPAYQPTTYNNGTTTGIPLNTRGTPDVAYDAARESAASVYDSYPHSKPNVYNGIESGWFAVGGTSVGAPQWASLIALADQGRAQAGLASLGSASVLSTLYANPSDFHDIVSGTSTGSPNFTAAPGYDLVTGLGSPQAPLVVSSLIGVAPTAAPASPNGLWGVPSDGKISLLWNATSGATSWNIYRSTDGITYTLFASASGTSFVDSGLTDGVSYFYEVTAVNSIGESAPSAAVSTTPQVPPPAPVLQSATPSNNTFSSIDFSYAITLQWTASSGAAGYEVLRSATSGSGYAPVASGVSGTSYTDTSVYAASKFYYVVEAVNAAGAISANSNQLSATTIPSAPATLTATAGRAQASLTWTASGGATSYNILRSTINGSGYTTIASGITGTSYTNTGLTSGTTYYYVVQAVDVSGPSVNSIQASATPTKNGK